MMKKLPLLFVLVTSLLQAQKQSTIKGIMTPAEKTDWVILQKLEGTIPKFITNTTIKLDSVAVKGVQKFTGEFELLLPKNAPAGMYRAIYRNSGAGFIDFLYSGENITMKFNPKSPDESIVFVNSKENEIYNSYQKEIVAAQGTLDSIQYTFFDSEDKAAETPYKKAVKKIEDLQKKYEKKSKGMLANYFVKASKQTNAPSLETNPNDYLNTISLNYFKHIDFKSKELYNSAFFINKVVEYVFYLNTDENQQLQQGIYKKSIAKVIDLIGDDKKLKKEITEYLITTFTNKRNSEIVDWLLASYYDALPNNIKTKNFKEDKLKSLAVSVGRTAPDFSWKEDGKKYKLSSLNDGERYLLIFWSTQCSHCVKEIPAVYDMIKKYKNTSVVAFAIEEDDLDFNDWSKNKLYDWHNVMGTHPTNRYENKTVQEYLIAETPTYFILDKNKKIIAVPDGAQDVQDYLNSLTKESKK